MVVKGLIIIVTCPASGAVNDLRSSMNIRTLDATMRIPMMVLIYLMKRLIKLLTYGREWKTEELNREFI